MTQRLTTPSFNSDEEDITLRLIRMIQDCEVNAMDFDRLYKEGWSRYRSRSDRSESG